MGGCASLVRSAPERSAIDDLRLQIDDFYEELASVGDLTPQALQDRLLDFATAVCRSLRRMRRDVIGIHIAKQLLRSATSPAANYAAARGAESRRDFVHKVPICLKELLPTQSQIADRQLYIANHDWSY